MEQLAPPPFNPHLKRVLTKYQSVALNSLSGPSGYSQAWGPVKVQGGGLLELDTEYRKALLVASCNGALPLNPHSSPSSTSSPLSTSCKTPDQHPLSHTNSTEKQTKLEPFVSTSPPFPSPLQQQQQQTAPLFLPMDSNPGIRSQTILEGYTITCFIVGGEKRLCLPQILNSVLRDFSLDQINAICDELHIFCSRCNPEQLHIMREKGDLPQTAASCGLITKTDAERLCNALLHGVPEKCKEPPSPSSFKVYHECFGKCKGLFDPVLYTTPYDKCIECLDCHGMFAPQKFVCHSHKSLENRTCHWGFDSANWRHYLLLSKDQENRDRLQELLDQVKAKFDYKRKQSDNEGLDSKRSRYHENPPTPTAKLEGPPTTWAEANQFRSMSAFRPWSPSLLNILKEAKVPGVFRDGMQRVLPPYLHTGPPVLLNPERVIPHSDTSRYEPHFAPNVSLAPASQQKCKEEEGEEEQPKIHTQVATMCKMEENFGIEVSSDTENSSLRSTDSSVPTTPRDDHRHMLTSPLVDGTADREQQVQMMRRLLEGKLPDSAEMKEHYMEEFVRIQRRQEERWHCLHKAHKDLEQELEYVKITKKERLREASEAKRGLRKELEIQREQHETKLKDVQSENQRLRHDVEATHGKQVEVTQVREKYRRRVDNLRSRLHQSEHENMQLRKQVAMLHEEFKKLGKEPPEFIASPPPPYSQNHSSPNHRRESADSDKSHDSHESQPLAATAEENRS